MTFYATGKLQTKEVYDNALATKNTNYKKYTYAADGTTVTEIVSYYDLKWHKDSNFTAVLSDGFIHAQRSEIYSAIHNSSKKSPQNRTIKLPWLRPRACNRI